MRRMVLSAGMVCLAAAWLGWPPAALSHGSLTTTVLFDREIVRILNSHCVMCHGDRSLSFPLSTYEQTWVRGRSIRMEVLRRHMPPWPAVAGYGQFVNDNGLTFRETQFIVSWVEGLGPRNAGTVFLNVARPGVAPPEVRATAHLGHWQLGEPDLSRELTATRVEAGRGDFIARTVVDLALASERHLRAIEFMPGDPRVVRAAVFFVESTGQWLGSWTPWHGSVELPSGVAARLPAGTRVVAEIHYRSASEPVVDRGTLGLFFDEGSRPKFTSDVVLDARDAASIEGEVQKLRASTTIAADTYVWALRPDLLPGLTSIEVAARTRDGGTEVLLLARDPRVEWPTPYIMKEPRLLPAGTEVSVVAYRRAVGDRAQAPMRLSISRY